MDPPNLRSRHPPASEHQPDAPTSQQPRKTRALDAEGAGGRGVGVLDLLRVLGGVVLLSCTLSYLVTGSKSFVWNYNFQPERLRAWIRGPLLLTPSQLLLHDGRSFPSVPIYVALNGTIYDVSASPEFYGPGGSYHFFAGRDATRAFVTGCFTEDLTGDLRGVERMFIPVDDDDDEGGQGESKERRRARKIRREREVREAKRKVWEAVEGWRKMFDGGKGGKYFRVGILVGREEEWGEVPPLCAKAEKARPRRDGGK